MTVRISTADEPPATRLDYWRHVSREAFIPLDLRTDQDSVDYRGQLVSRDLGPAWVNHVRASSGQAHRGPTHIRQSEVEVYKLELQLGGRILRGAQDERQALLERLDFTLFDMTRPYTTGSPTCPQHFLAVMFPRSMLPLCPDEVARLTATRFCGRRGVGGLISQLLTGLATDLDDYDAAEATTAATAALDLLTTALAGQLDRANRVPDQTRRGALLTRVHAFIEQRLVDPDLSPAMVAAAHHVSLRYLQKLFAAQGASVADWIRQRRLERSRRELLDPRARLMTVGAVAARWGFTDPAQFSRVFRAAYGCPPGEYRYQHLDATPLPTLA